MAEPPCHIAPHAVQVRLHLGLRRGWLALLLLLLLLLQQSCMLLLLQLLRRLLWWLHSMAAWWLLTSAESGWPCAQIHATIGLAHHGQEVTGRVVVAAPYQPAMHSPSPWRTCTPALSNRMHAVGPMTRPGMASLCKALHHADQVQNLKALTAALLGLTIATGNAA